MKRGIKLLLLTDLWATLALGMIGPIYAIFVEDIGGNIMDAGWAYAAFMITSGIMLYVLGKWEDHIKHKEKLLVLGYSLVAVGCLSYYFVDSQAMLVMTQIILGFAEAVQLPAADALYAKHTSRKHAASEWGSWEAMWYVATGVAAVIGSFIATVMGFKTLFLVMFAVSLLSVVFAFRLLLKD